jgi:hypothetical protein
VNLFVFPFVSVPCPFYLFFEVKDNKFLLEQKGIQEKAKESQVNELNTMIVQLQGNVDVSEKQLNLHFYVSLKLHNHGI